MSNSASLCLFSTLLFITSKEQDTLHRADRYAANYARLQKYTIHFNQLKFQPDTIVRFEHIFHHPIPRNLHENRFVSPKLAQSTSNRNEQVVQVGIRLYSSAFISIPITSVHDFVSWWRYYYSVLVRSRIYCDNTCDIVIMWRLACVYYSVLKAQRASKWMSKQELCHD